MTPRASTPHALHGSSRTMPTGGGPRGSSSELESVAFVLSADSPGSPHRIRWQSVKSMILEDLLSGLSEATRHLPNALAGMSLAEGLRAYLWIEEGRSFGYPATYLTALSSSIPLSGSALRDHLLQFVLERLSQTGCPSEDEG